MIRGNPCKSILSHRSLQLPKENINSVMFIVENDSIYSYILN